MSARGAPTAESAASKGMLEQGITSPDREPADRAVSRKTRWHGFTLRRKVVAAFVSLVIMVGVCGAAGIALETALTAWLHAFAANLVSVAVRAIPLGQSDAVAVIAGLEDVILRTAARAAEATLDDLGSGAIASDIAAMRHETLDGRLFIS